MIVYENSFEWNMRDATTNLARHGVSFKEAATVFVDPARVLAGESGAVRKVTGLSARSRTLVVEHVPGPRIRILSATVEAGERRTAKAAARAPEPAPKPVVAPSSPPPPPAPEPSVPVVPVARPENTRPLEVPASKVGYVMKRPARRPDGQPVTIVRPVEAPKPEAAPPAPLNGAAKAEVAKVEVAKSEVAKVDVAKSEIAKVEVAKAEVAKAASAPAAPVVPAAEQAPSADAKPMTEEERIAEEDRAYRAQRAQQTAKARAAAAAKRAAMKAAAEAAKAAETAKAEEAAKVDATPRSERRPKSSASKPPAKPSSIPPTAAEAAPKSSRAPRISWREAARQAIAKLR
ncbi:MAG: BrnT family toxin [Polyangiaceae bacterium]